MATASQAARQDARWITISDFAPGIVADHHGSSAPRAILRNGAATVENTYRCFADPHGGLAPLPRMDGVSLNFTPTMNRPTANLWPAFPNWYLVDVVVLPTSYRMTLGASVQDNSPSIYTLWAGFVSRTGANPYGHVMLGRAWRGSATAVDFFWESSCDYITKNSPNAGHFLPAGNLSTFRSTNGAGGPPIPVQNIKGGIMGAANIQLNHAAAAIPASETGWTTFDTDVGVNYPTGVATIYASGVAFAAPNPNSPTVDSTWCPTPASGLEMGTYCVIGHQGRMVVIRRVQTDFGGGTYQQDFVWYSPPLDLRANVFTSGTVEDQWTDDNIQSPISTGISVANDELFLIREHQGGVLVRGDLDNPTVQRLPNIPGTGGVTTMPLATPQGVVYLSRFGAYLWQGGETAQRLSVQLDGPFWNVYSSGEKFNGPAGRMAYWDPYIVFPNNYIMDTRTNAFWRLEDTATLGIPFNCYGVDPSTTNLLAFPAWLAGTSASATACRVFRYNVEASSFSWQSQPLIETLDRQVVASEVEVTVSPGSNVNTDQTVQVTVTGYSDAGVASSATKTFTFSGAGGSQPQIFRGNLSAEVAGRYMQVRLVSSGGSTGGGDANAPKILSVRVAVRDGNMPAKV